MSRMVLLTCRNHPNLRWVTKEISFSDEHGYLNIRNIFFEGEPTGEGLYADGSGLNCSQIRKNGSFVHECSCDPAQLIRAPEDAEIAKAYQT